MMPWFKIKKREGNAVWRGQDLGVPRPKVEAIVMLPPKPRQFQPKVLFPKDTNVSK